MIAGTHCNFVLEPLELTNLHFTKTQKTKHLLPITDYTVYSPISLPASVQAHPEFGETKQFLVDGILFDTVEMDPAITFRTPTGQKIIKIVLDSSFSTLKMSSGIAVRESLKSAFYSKIANVFN